MISIDPKYNIYDTDLNEGDEDYQTHSDLTLEGLRDAIFDLQYDEYVEDQEPDTDKERLELEEKFTEFLNSCDLPKLQCILEGVAYAFTEVSPSGEETYVAYGDDVIAYFTQRNQEVEERGTLWPSEAS